MRLVVAVLQAPGWGQAVAGDDAASSALWGALGAARLELSPVRLSHYLGGRRNERKSGSSSGGASSTFGLGDPDTALHVYAAFSLLADMQPSLSYSLLSAAAAPPPPSLLPPPFDALNNGSDVGDGFSPLGVDGFPVEDDTAAAAVGLVREERPVAAPLAPEEALAVLLASEVGDIHDAAFMAIGGIGVGSFKR